MGDAVRNVPGLQRALHAVVTTSPPTEPKPAPKAAPPPVEKPRGLKPHTLNAIGQLLRAERLKRGLNQVDAAKLLSLQENMLSRIELAEDQPDDDTMLRAAEVFAVPIEALLAARDGAENYADPLTAIKRIAELESANIHVQNVNSELQAKLAQARTHYSDLQTKCNAAQADANKLRAAPPVTLVAPFKLDAALVQKIHTLLQRMTGVLAVPTDDEKRLKSWYESVISMYEAG